MGETENPTIERTFEFSIKDWVFFFFFSLEVIDKEFELSFLEIV